MYRKTKIVCTIGPASEEVAVLKKLIENGMNVARLNFSHGDYEEHGARINNIRQAAKETGKTVAILLDTKGPEIRTGVIGAPQVELKQGENIILTTEEIIGDEHKISITYDGLPNDVSPGSTILIDDGLIGLEVLEIEENEIHCKILNSGILKSKKGVNVPGVKINLPGITEKDANDIRFGIEQGLDFIAASFVRKASDVLEIRKILEEYDADIQIISKIENQEGVENIDEILQVSDGIMVARGDLGVEIPAEDVPLVQKMIINKCNEAGKPVITATQMLDSMQRNPRPTRAEASDVANAIFDGTDAIMLSGETAAGKYPVESVATMARIAMRTEESLNFKEIFKNRSKAKHTTVTDAISESVVNTAIDLDVNAILTPTESGQTAKFVSKYRPKAPIIAVTPHEDVLRKLSLVWGVIPVIGTTLNSTDEMLTSSVEKVLEAGYIKHGDLVVITAGVPVGQPGTTNLMKVHLVGDLTVRGQGIGNKVVTGKVVKGKNAAEIREKMEEGAVLVTISTDKDMMDAFKKASAVITEEGGLTSHAAVVGIELGIPVIVGAENAYNKFEDGMIVTVDTGRGHVYVGQSKLI
ncbi:pyruvate kinase [Vulcanibacillus modesticaldus]|uniref:Pyruvate kinase n=1 Tax=Vulcanibacillus modesticaldus TaxID=337097 RepID=A0A1D2YWJ3_9BACI|nr:pyruvate kinase [Vulcanibacillus modesticaldus]OEG00079.1 pyruvate kinase [Vulcanibacillus modesticaldus]